MAKPALSVTTDTAKLTALKTKLAKYPKFAMLEGLRAASALLNEDSFRESMYPPESDEPFTWSSEKQRRAFFATDGFGRGIPTRRTHELMLSGRFRIEESTLWVLYENVAPYSPWVMSPQFQIIGHKKRGWKPVNTFVVGKSKEIARVFTKATKDAWNKMKAYNVGDFGL